MLVAAASPRRASKPPVEEASSLDGPAPCHRERGEALVTRERSAMRSVTRKVLLLGAVAAVAVGSVAALASAGPGNRPAITVVSPSPTEGSTVTSDTASFAFIYNRKPKATEALTCSLSG